MCYKNIYVCVAATTIPFANINTCTHSTGSKEEELYDLARSMDCTSIHRTVTASHLTNHCYTILSYTHTHTYTHSTGSKEEELYDESDLARSMDKITAIDYHQVVYHNGVKFWCYNAGHVLGACMFMIEIAGTKVGVGVLRDDVCAYAPVHGDFWFMVY